MPSDPDPAGRSHPKVPLVVLLGPTAVGKTEIALRLAERLDGEIISADSRLFYRGMDIGTAKPTAEQLERVPHHLIDIANPDQVVSLAEFQAAARQSIFEIDARGRLPLMVGGAGQYVRAVTKGWEAPRVEPHPSLREALEMWAQKVGPEGLHRRLATLDPEAAEKIDYRNVRRSIRALEVILLTGKPFTSQKRRGDPPYKLVQLGLTRPRAELYSRIDDRVEAMIGSGLLEEVQALLERGYSAELPPLSAIGYREIISHLQGEITLEEAVTQIKRATRVLVRRQANWFKQEDPEIRWFRAGPGVIEDMEVEITNLLADKSRF